MSIMQEYQHKRLKKVIVRVVPLRNYVNYYYYLIVKEELWFISPVLYIFGAFIFFLLLNFPQHI